jgi:hypothetical protein
MMTQPWTKIRSYYEGLPHGVQAFDSMRNLVEEIVKSRYVAGIYAWTSMHDLCIVQTEVTYPYDGPFLRISPKCPDGKLEFRYIDTHIKDKQWHRTVDAKDGFARLEGFFYQVHWFYPVPDKNEDTQQSAKPDTSESGPRGQP